MLLALEILPKCCLVPKKATEVQQEAEAAQKLLLKLACFVPVELLFGDQGEPEYKDPL